MIAEVRPDEFYNLAGLSSVSRSFDDPIPDLAFERRRGPGTARGHSGRKPGDAVLPVVVDRHVRVAAGRGSDPRRDLCVHAPEPVCGRQGRRPRPVRRLPAGVRPAGRLRDPVEPRVTTSSGIVPDRQGRGLGTRAALGRATAISLISSRCGSATWPSAANGGFAPEYVDGMIRICRQIAVRAEVAEAPAEVDVGSNYRDYVLGSGRQHAVWELIDQAFGLAGFTLDWDRSSDDPADWTAWLAQHRRPRRRRRSVVHPARRSGDHRDGPVASARRTRLAADGPISTRSSRTCSRARRMGRSRPPRPRP